MNFKNSLLVFISLVLVSCSFWTNFTTFFNTYYNARKLFEEVEEEIKKNQTDIFAFEQEKLSAASIKKIDNIIEKTSKILELDSNSAFLDNALLMTGKAFYYKEQYSKALRKFRELSVLKDTELDAQGILWAGKSQIRLKDFVEGLSLLNRVKETALKTNPGVYYDACIFEIAYQIYNESFDEAISSFNELIPNIEDEEFLSETYYRLAVLYFEQEESKLSEEAFNNALKFSPSYFIELNSQLKLSQILQSQDKLQESNNILESLLSQSKFTEDIDLINLQVGINLYEQKIFEQAFTAFAAVDTAKRNTEAGGVARYYQGVMLEDNYGDYDSAAVLYSRAAISSADKDIRDFSRNRIIIIDRYDNITEDITKWLKQLQYNQDPEIFIKDSLEYVEQVYRDTAKIFNQDNPDSLKTNEQTEPKERSMEDPELSEDIPRQNEPSKKPVVQQIVRIKPVNFNFSADTLYILLIDEYLDKANLFFTEFNKVDSAKVYYERIYSLRPRIYKDPNLLFALGAFYETDNKLRSDSLYRYIYENFQDNPIVNLAAKIIGKEEFIFDLAPDEKLYMKAEEHYYKNNVQRAVNIFKQIPVNYPTSEFVPKTYYTLGWIYENDLNQPDSAVVYYEKLFSRYRTTTYTRLIQNKLNFFKFEKRRIEEEEKAKSIKLDSTQIKTPQINKENVETKKHSAADSTKSSVKKILEK